MGLHSCNCSEIQSDMVETNLFPGFWVYIKHLITERLRSTSSQNSKKQLSRELCNAQEYAVGNDSGLTGGHPVRYVYILIPETYESDFIWERFLKMWLRILRWDHPGLSRRTRGPMTGFFLRETEETHRTEGGNVFTEAKVRGMWPRVKESWQPPEQEETKNTFFP